MNGAGDAAAVEYLDGRHLSLALSAGVHRVLENQDLLNRINVFPVADGDTGTNLALTLSAVRGALQGADELPANRVLIRVADAMLDGARGNSGAILAQFFQGVSDAAVEVPRITPEAFARAVAVGSEYARDALSEPREGTILSVVAAFASRLREQLGHMPKIDFPSLLGGGLEAARKALAETTHQLDVLRKAGVVDAGAQGFVEMVAGMLDYVRDGKIVDLDEADFISVVEEFSATAGEDSDLDYRYCTECMVTGEEIDRRKLREQLSALGASLVLAGTRRKAKIHIHVNEPEEVFRVAAGHGAVSGEKADDMHRQQHATHGAGVKVAVITDSAADIPEEEMERLDIHVVPMRISFGNQGYLDKVSITPDEFFEELKTNPVHPTTSQPAPGDFRRQYQFLASHFPDVVSVSLTGKVSGTLEAARSAAERVHADGRIHVIDSLNVSLGQGLVAVHAAECARAGLDAAAVVAETEWAVAHTWSFGLVQDLRYAVRGGRVPRSRKVVAEWLNLNPVLRTTPDGQVTSGGVIFGRANRLPKFVRYVARRVASGCRYRLAVAHAQCGAEAQELRRRLEARLDRVEQSWVTELGTAIGVHGGPGTLVVSLQELREPGS